MSIFFLLLFVFFYLQAPTIQEVSWPGPYMKATGQSMTRYTDRSVCHVCTLIRHGKVHHMHVTPPGPPTHTHSQAFRESFLCRWELRFFFLSRSFSLPLDPAFFISNIVSRNSWEVWQIRIPLMRATFDVSQFTMRRCSTDRDGFKKSRAGLDFSFFFFSSLMCRYLQRGEMQSVALWLLIQTKLSFHHSLTRQDGQTSSFLNIVIPPLSHTHTHSSSRTKSPALLCPALVSCSLL